MSLNPLKPRRLGRPPPPAPVPFPPTASCPPKVGEYAYFDSRHTGEASSFPNARSWEVQCEGSEYNIWCHYSLGEKIDKKQNFITCHGLISCLLTYSS